MVAMVIDINNILRTKSHVGLLCIFMLPAVCFFGQASAQKVSVKGQQASVAIGKKPVADISPNIYGQFIEFLGHCINGGIYDKGSALSDENGFRKDVMEKVKQLNPPLLRYPGGTFTKIYHWEDGIGPVEKRPGRKNLIWGGVEDNAFGTAEFVNYCRKIGAEPFLVINMATGTPEEAAHWVEYCNGTENTYYANLRRQHGYSQPFNVKYWGLGNEEEAVPDAGKLQNPVKYCEDAWQYIKLMKMTDTSLKLVIAGGTPKWNETVLKSLSGAVNYLSMHLYAGEAKGRPVSLYENIAGFQNEVAAMQPILKKIGDTVTNWSKWYRFPSRQGPLTLAFDEWGIWKDANESTSNLEATYTWRDALATAGFLNIFQRNANITGLATWAQLVNTLAPIIATKDGSYYQTVFYPLSYYHKYAGGQALPVQVKSPLLPQSTSAFWLDVSATFSSVNKTITLFIVNRSATVVSTNIQLQGTGTKMVHTISLTAGTGTEKVNIQEGDIAFDGGLVLQPESLSICVFNL